MLAITFCRDVLPDQAGGKENGKIAKRRDAEEQKLSTATQERCSSSGYYAQDFSAISRNSDADRDLPLEA